MNKGFEYWESDRVLSFIRKYWVIYCIFYMLGVLLAVREGNPLVFLIIGSVPSAILFAYKIIHDPFYNIVDSIKKIAPTLLEELLEKSVKMQIRMGNADNKRIAKIVYAAIMLLSTENIDKRIVSYKRNNKKASWASGVGLAIWFFTFLLLLFALYVK